MKIIERVACGMAIPQGFISQKDTSSSYHYHYYSKHQPTKTSGKTPPSVHPLLNPLSKPKLTLKPPKEPLPPLPRRRRRRRLHLLPNTTNTTARRTTTSRVFTPPPPPQRPQRIRLPQQRRKQQHLRPTTPNTATMPKPMPMPMPKTMAVVALRRRHPATPPHLVALRPVDARPLRRREPPQPQPQRVPVVTRPRRHGGVVFQQRVHHQGIRRRCDEGVPRVVGVGGSSRCCCCCCCGVGDGVPRAVAAEVFGGVRRVMVASPAREEPGELVLEGAPLRGLLVVVWLGGGGFFEDARALELVAVEELVALGLGLLERAGEFGGGEGGFRGAVVLGVGVGVGVAAACAEGFGAFEVEFEGVLGELVHEVAVAHVFDCGRSGELLGRFLWDVVVGF